MAGKKIRNTAKTENTMENKTKRNFIMLKNYPIQRKFIIRRKLKESFFEKLRDFFNI